MVAKKSDGNRLGVDKSSLSKLKPGDLRTAATANAVLSYLSALETESSELKTKVETQQTYVNGYNISQNNAKIAAFLSFISTIMIGFSINLFTSESSLMAAIVLLTAGAVLQIGSVILVFKK